MRVIAILMLTACAALAAEPPNAKDDFLAGWYGPLTNGSDGGKWFWEDNLDYLLTHGYDWVWVQGQSTLKWAKSAPPADLAKLRRLSGRARLLWEVFWWDAALTRHDHDWLTISRDDAQLQTVIDYIDREVDAALALTRGNLYAVTLSEEEPWRCPLNRGVDRQEFDDACVTVFNRIYRHLKAKHPELRVFHSFYPLPSIVGRLEYDGVAMDCYPQFPLPSAIESAVTDWKALYAGHEDEVYLLLWGICRGNQEARQDYYDQTFQAFRDAGFRNLGWFDTTKWTNPYQIRLERQVDLFSPETFAPRTAAEAVADERRRLAVVKQAIGQEDVAAPALSEAEALLDSGHPIEATRRRYRAMEAAQRHALPDLKLAMDIPTLLTGAAIARGEGWPISLDDGLAADYAKLVPRLSLDLGGCVNSLPAFRTSTAACLAKAKTAWQALRQLPATAGFPPRQAVEAMRQAAARDDQRQFVTALLEYCHRLATEGKLKGTLIRLVAVNPYPYDVRLDDSLFLEREVAPGRFAAVPLFNVDGRDEGVVEYLGYLATAATPALRLTIRGYDGVHLLDGLELLTPQGARSARRLADDRGADHKAGPIDGVSTELEKRRYDLEF